VTFGQLGQSQPFQGSFQEQARTVETSPPSARTLSSHPFFSNYHAEPEFPDQLIAKLGELTGVALPPA
jgi:hypothetical protein